MRRMMLAGLVALATSPALLADTPSGTLDLETIMASPDWIGAAVESPYWSVDGRSLYYSLKQDGSKVRDRYRVDVATGRGEKLGPEAIAQAEGAPVFDRQHRQAAYVLHGDVFLVDLGTSRRVQVTRTSETETAPRFSSDGRALQYRRGNQWFAYDIAAGVAAPAAVLNTGEDPQDKQPDALTREQLRLFKSLRTVKAEKDAARANEDALSAVDPGRAPRPIWLGDVGEVIGTELSPDGRWMVVVTQPKDYKAGKAPEVTHYVTESGYAEQQPTRAYVGRRDPAPQSLWLVDLRARKSYPLDTGVLPGIKDDPLKVLRAKAIAALEKEGHADEAKALKAPEKRAVRVISTSDDGGGGGIAWSDDGANVAIQMRAIDNKDRWIATVDLDRHALINQHRLTDNAWINWNFNDFGWLKDGRTLWYLSEETGWSQLYAKQPGSKARALTQGRFEVSHPVLSEDGQWFYVRSNQVAPYSYDVYRVPAKGGELTRLTRYEGMDDFVLSPDGRQLAVLHSAPYVLPQLAVQDGGGAARELTRTMKPAFAQRSWIAPKIVPVPSSHGAGTIWAKYYGPVDEPPGSRPAVIFVHGAGYLQNVTLGWSNYFREQMFHNLLVQRGYVVLDMDYRASEGYGRDWRTAIYRQMGHPELDDLLDGKAWLVREHGVDPHRVGIYGGSYGGFMTLMALLRAPGAFAAGSALRPVTDWTSYNHEYTSNILNDPQLDPDAYATSSPIEYADQLRDPLLIQHGLIDDNVLTSDTIRLYQRFIELHKKNFWMSLYPMERHGFVQPDSWYDEYRRIAELFDTYVKPAKPSEVMESR